MTSESEPASSRAPGAEVRELRPEERAAWLEFRARLWPETPREQLRQEQDHILAEPESTGVLFAALSDGEPIGFAEVSIRAWAEGCVTRPVGYIEAWYVIPEQRRAGMGRLLIDAAERWARARGCVEMASDADPENRTSRSAHRALGYDEVGMSVLFRKRIAP